ncbi:MAG: excinuclease ABC subunit UvrA [Desulfurella sp.]|uniref:excinuclease ABC subunit UvrA n=1 Tax=Desulfurella sp. TaxID=1962857 RepID=UPI003D10FEA2
MQDHIFIKGARQHNLKNIDIKIPKFKIVSFVGPSGSGKSTIVFDIVYAEGQRRYIESLSAYTRQFLEKLEKSDVDYITGLSPSISIDQKLSSNSRSTVGTTTEIYDYMRLIWANLAQYYCYNCGRKIEQQTPQAIINKISQLKGKKILIMRPIAINKKGEFSQEFNLLAKQGFVRIIADDIEYTLDDPPKLDKNKKHTIFLVVDRIVVNEDSKERVQQSIELALKNSKTVYVKDIQTNAIEVFSTEFSCPVCNINYSPKNAQSFSFNSPLGACPVCHGLGFVNKLRTCALINENLSIKEGAIIPFSKPRYAKAQNYIIQKCISLGIDVYMPFKDLTTQQKDVVYFGSGDFDGIISMVERFFESDPIFATQNAFLHKSVVCPDCNGFRLNKESLSAKIEGKNIIEVTNLCIDETLDFFKNLEKKLDPTQKQIAKNPLNEIIKRLQFLVDLNLDYLSLSRSTATLSGGEAQRVKLATQIGTSLSGVTYCLDEPSIGLHPSETEKLIKILKELRDLGNTILMVEHNEFLIKNSDYIIDIGPKSGKFGGEICAEGSLDQILTNENSLTGKYLSGKLKIEVPPKRNFKDFLKLKNVNVHNIKNLNVDIPLGCLVGISGVSGSGKSSLIFDFLLPKLKEKINIHQTLNREAFQETDFNSNDNEFFDSSQSSGDIENFQLIERIIAINQSPIGRTPRSNPATYTSVFTDIRELFANVTQAKILGFTPSRFSFNVAGGRCEKCKGEGYIKVEMQFLPDVYVLCEACGGKRYNDATLSVYYKDKNIADVLNMSIDEAYEFFDNIPKIKNKLGILKDIGLGYIKLGQNATTLSGGEAQRIKLAKELITPPNKKTLYLFDEPSRGLHPDDIKKLLHVINRLIDSGHSVIIIEHDLDILKCADYIIDMGIGGGDKGGQVVAKGTVYEIAKNPKSITGKYLKEKLEESNVSNRRNRLSKSF